MTTNSSVLVKSSENISQLLNILVSRQLY